MDSTDLDASVMDMDDHLLQQLAAGGGDGGSTENTFSIATGIHLRKNLASKFDEQVGAMDPPPPVVPRKLSHPKPPQHTKRIMRSAAASKVLSVETVSPPKKVAKLSNASTASTSTATSISVSDRVAKIERSHSNAASSMNPTTLRPPLPISIPQASNAIPPNRMSVYLRIRPSAESEGDNESTIKIAPPSKNHQLPTSVRTFPPPGSKVATAKEFSFHQVLAPSTSQRAVYTTVAAPLVAKMCEDLLGKDAKKASPVNASVLLFSYGITNAGKTYTILGGGDSVTFKNDNQWGILPRAIADLLARSAPDKAGKGPSFFELNLSFFEIYNEQLFDLLPNKSQVKKDFGMPKPLKLSERNGQPIIRGLARHRVSNLERGITLAAEAHQRRKTSSNNLNVDSSRSHCICQLQLVEAPKQPPGTISSNENDDEASVVTASGYSTDEEATMWSQRKMATMWVVDLAGSERSKRTGLAGHQKESSQINRSLMTLMRCLTVMRENTRQRQSAIIPFRESKLTHLFMGHLTGPSAGDTAMIVNVNPRIADFDETQHVLAYASKSKSIDMDCPGQKRKRQGTDSNLYDSDGHRIQPGIVAAKIIRKVVRKLSPKRNPAKTRAASRRPSPRQAPQERQDKPDGSDRKVAKKEASKGKRAGGVSSKDAALQQALAENDELRKRIEEMNTQLENIESQVRSEVADELDVNMAYNIKSYQDELTTLREQVEFWKNKQVNTQTVRKLRAFRDEQIKDELMENIRECEDEMVRMREAHAEEVARIRKAHTEEIRRLEQSKIEIIESYEALLNEEEDEEDDVENRRATLVPDKSKSASGSKVIQVENVRKPLSSIANKHP